MKEVLEPKKSTSIITIKFSLPASNKEFYARVAKAISKKIMTQCKMLIKCFTPLLSEVPTATRHTTAHNFYKSLI